MVSVAKAPPVAMPRAGGMTDRFFRPLAAGADYWTIDAVGRVTRHTLASVRLAPSCLGSTNLSPHAVDEGGVECHWFDVFADEAAARAGGRDRAKRWAEYHAGRLQEARSVLESLTTDVRPGPGDVVAFERGEVVVYPSSELPRW